MRMFAILALLFSTSLASANIKSIDCTYKSGPDKSDKVASIEYVRKTVIKSIWLAPSKNSYYEEQVFADGCRKVSNKKKAPHKYKCSNPWYDIEIVASFDGKLLKIYDNHSNKVRSVFRCK